MLSGRKKYFLFLIFSNFLITTNLSAQEIITIEQNDPSKTISQNKLQWLVDTSGLLSFEKIKKQDFTSLIKNDSTPFDKDWSLWNKLLIKNSSGTDQEYLLQTNKWGVYEAFINSDNNDFNHLVSGSLVPLQERSQPSNVNAIKFLIKKDETKTFFLKFRSEYSIYTHRDISLQLVKQSYFENNDKQRLLWQGLFFGIILVMALYNLFILFAVRDISYLYYVLSIVSIGLYFVFYYGFGIEYLWPHSPLWDTFCFAIINPFTGLARILFTRTYLHSPQLLPSINKILNVLAITSVATLVTGLSCFIFKIDLLKPLVIIIGVLGALILIMMLIAGIAAYYLHKYEPAKYFIAANILLVLGAIAFILRETGLINDNFISRYLVQYGVLIQAVVLSLGLASRLNRMRLQLANETLEKERLALEKEKEKKELIEQQKLELQQQVKEKTADLQNKNIILEETIGKVKESETKLSELNQVKDKLFSIVSHDLRNPLATMQSFLKLIKEHHEKMNEDERKKLLTEAQQSLDNLNELLYNLLLWSKSQMNFLQFRKDKLNVKSTIENSVRMLHLHARMKNIEIKTEVEEGLTANADKEIIEFVIRNLLSNAIKFSYRSSEVDIRAFSENGNVKIIVKDTGIGMNESKIKKLLEKHSTFTRRGTEKEKGTGLGLLVSKEFIEKTGGTLQIQSEPGKGSVFTFALPLHSVTTHEVQLTD
jgi:signal transduction histidine kinase